MWIVYAFLSAGFAGITAILAKCGVKDISSTVATAIRTIIILIFSWLMVLLKSSTISLAGIEQSSLWFLLFSGIATGASWLCYFKALQIGDVNKVAAIDKSSVVLTMLLAILFFQEECSWLHLVGILFIGIGTLLMITRRKQDKAVQGKSKWMTYAILSAVFASMTTILGKAGVESIDSTLATALRTIVVLVMAWLMVFIKKEQKEVRGIQKNNLIFLVLSGISTGASWLCYYRALQSGPASVVVPIDKLSIVLTVLFSVIILKEKIHWKAWIGLAVIIGGTLLLIF